MNIILYANYTLIKTKKFLKKWYPKVYYVARVLFWFNASDILQAQGTFSCAND